MTRSYSASREASMFEEESNFVEMKKRSALKLTNISDNIELFLIKMAPDMINPSELINKEMVISKKQTRIKVKENIVEVETQKGMPVKNFTLLISSSSDGELIAVNKKISCQVVLKTETEEVVKKELDESLFESVSHKPLELQRRDFYTSSAKEQTRTKLKKNKRKKSNSNITDESADGDISLTISSKKQKNSRKRKREDSNLCDESSFGLEEQNAFSESPVKKKKKKNIK